MEGPSGPHPDADGKFPTTHWSLVLAAAGGTSGADPGRFRAALAALCEAYWYPVYAFIRRKGHGSDEAADLTQGLFASLLERRDWGAADRNRGRFRAWLLGAAKHYLADEWDRRRALKRGGGRQPLSFEIDSADAEDRYRLEPADDMTPERLFDRRWARDLLQGVVAALRRECDREGKGRQFDLLKGTLTGEGASSPYKQISVELGMSEGAVKVAAHRLRKRYREVLREQIAQTVGSDREVEEEIRDLFAALR